MRLVASGQRVTRVPTVAEFWERYREAILASVRPHTASGYEVAWRRRVRVAFGDRPLDAVTPPNEAPLHWHDLRHTALTNLALGRLVMPDLMAVAGHSTLQVTQRYLNTKADAAQRAATLQSDFYADFEVTPRSGPEGGEAARSPALQGS